LPAPARVMPKATDRSTAERLWRLAEEATGVHYLSEAVASV
ncbi:MAG: short-chain dehydrogenase, partial [Bacteroidota bacterium]